MSSRSSTQEQVPFIARGTWPHGPMRPTPPTWGALFPLTVRRFGPNCGTHTWADFMHGKTLSAGFYFPTGAKWRTGCRAWKGKMAASITWWVFDQIRCRKSPARGFWTSGVHWNHFHMHLKSPFSGFSHLKFEEASGALKPSLFEALLWWAHNHFLRLNSHFWLIIMLWTHWDRFQIHWRTSTGIFSSFKFREAWRSHVEEVIVGWAIVHLQSFNSHFWGFYVFWTQWYNL